MKKEIGSIFPLYDAELTQAESIVFPYSSDRTYYSLCREALFAIAQSFRASKKSVLIPAYTCQTVIAPFEDAGWHCIYYSIKRDLRIDTLNLMSIVHRENPALVVVHPYFGMDLNEVEIDTLLSIKRIGIDIILDLTQCLFSTMQYKFASFIVASYRKWMPIPDGGYLKCLSRVMAISQPEIENTEFVEKEIAAMYLRGQYFENNDQRTKAISIQLSKSADRIAERNIESHKMSQISYNLLCKEDLKRNQSTRRLNYTYLFQNINESNSISKVCCDNNKVTTAPLYFTIYVRKRSELQHLLSMNSIYAPILWPVEDERVLINEDIHFIYTHLLAIPCDQRYDEKDMQRVVEIINDFKS